MEGPCYIKKLSHNCLSNVFQFFDAKEMMKYSCVSHQFLKTQKIDYLWKILSANQSMFVSKRKKESWRDAYIRHVMCISKNMKGGYLDPKTGKSIFNYQMCPIRQHSEVIKQVEIYGNVIISLDEEGVIDPEECKSCKIDEYQGRDVLCFNFIPSNNTLFVVDSKLNISLYHIEIDEDKEQCKVTGTSYSSHVDLFGFGDDMEVEDHKVSQDDKIARNPVVNFFGNRVIIANDFREKLEHEKGNILILNRENGDILKTITCNFDGLNDGMNMDIEGPRIDPVKIWNFFDNNIKKNTICYDYRYDRVYFSDYLCNIDVYDTTNCKFKTNILIKKYRSDIDQQEERLTNELKEVVFSINLNDSFIYVTTNFYIYAIKRSDLTVKTCMKLSGIPIKINFFPVSKEERDIIKNDENEVFISKITFGYSDKTNLCWSTIYHFIKNEEIVDINGNKLIDNTSSFKLVSEGAMEKKNDPEYYHFRRYYSPFHNIYQFNEAINSVDVSNTLAVCAAKDMKVSVFDIGTGKKVYHLPAGSKIVKSYKEHPQKQGVSDIKICEDKILLVLGNICSRLYLPPSPPGV